MNLINLIQKIKLVEFYANGLKIDEASTSPYSTEFVSSVARTVDLSVLVTDNDVATNNSNIVSIEILTVINQSAYPDGTPKAVPGEINATYYDIGGEGIADVASTGAWTSYTTLTIEGITMDAGEYRVVTPEDISFVNSWNMELVEINGVDYTNTWSSSFPEKVNGNYYIQYKGTLGWPDFEAASVKSAEGIETTASVKVFPNPFEGSTRVFLTRPESVNAILIFDQVGKLVYSFTDDKEIELVMNVGERLEPGVYYLKVITDKKYETIILNK